MLAARTGASTGSSASGAESFRSSWELFWSALGSGADETAETGAEATNPQAPSSAEMAAQPKTMSARQAGTPGSAKAASAGQSKASATIAGPTAADVAALRTNAQTAVSTATTGQSGSGTETVRAARSEKPDSEAQKTAGDGTGNSQAQPQIGGSQAISASDSAIASASATQVQPQTTLDDLPQVDFSGGVEERSFLSTSEQGSAQGAQRGPAGAATTASSSRLATESSGGRGGTSSEATGAMSGPQPQSGESELSPAISSNASEIAAATVAAPPDASELAGGKSQEAKPGRALEQSASSTVGKPGATGAASVSPSQSGVSSDTVTASGTGKSGPDAATESFAQSTVRLLHGAAADASLATVHLSSAQGASDVDGAQAMVRDAAGVHGLANASGTGGGETGLAGATAHEAFDALDASAEPGTPNWTHAGGQRAEAGFEDPALGWVGVRADLSGGSIHAAVVPASADAAQALSGHMAGLGTYLSEHHSTVATLTMSSPAGAGTESSAEQTLQQNSGGQTDRNTTAEAQASGQSNEDARAQEQQLSDAAQGAGFGAIAFANEGRGMHVSVLA
ncbi:MAG: hypothetical protein ACLQG3_12080 [Terracidiphilus sp.]